MSTTNSSDWETISHGSSDDTACSAESGFRSTLKSETVSSLLDAYSAFYSDMFMMLNLPSKADATLALETSLPDRLITDFEPNFTQIDSYQRLNAVYLKLRSEKTGVWKGFCNEIVAPFLYTFPVNEVNLQIIVK